MTAVTGRCYDAHVPLLNVFDYEKLARQKLSQPFFDYIAGGADDELTLRRNREAFERIELKPRALVDVSVIDLSTKVLGQRVEMPVLLAPVAVQRLAHPEGELATARAAAQAGTIMTLSTMASASSSSTLTATPAPRVTRTKLIGCRSPYVDDHAEGWSRSSVVGACGSRRRCRRRCTMATAARRMRARTAA